MIRHGGASHDDGQRVGAVDRRVCRLPELIELSLEASRLVVEPDRFPEMVVGDLQPEVLLHAGPEICQLLLIPVHLRLPRLPGEAHDSHEGRLQLLRPVVVDTAEVVAAVDENDAIEEIVLPQQRHVEAMTHEAAVQVAEIGVRQLRRGAARGSHSEGKETRGREDLLRDRGAEKAHDSAPLLLPAACGRVPQGIRHLGELREHLRFRLQWVILLRRSRGFSQHSDSDR